MGPEQAGAVFDTEHADLVRPAPYLWDPIGQASVKAASRGLGAVRFIRADATRWTPEDGRRYDLALCAYGVFFLADMDDCVARPAGFLRPGGRFAVTPWAEAPAPRNAGA
ncbi:hypothetical protein GCM10010156_72400 [Planobispora rosea]|uniref:Methyltransferase type 11 domain-containing protein n=1 Tax=Planobispora rosea TaxID=35762 RepID=A0A8J3WGR4_PLARO|nr:class I SAM-dependent methyltransferase [Planobispora rosea]GGT04053.1 hypothetical protein GCM10010156_72400 [Planobispora rosea]GIH88805.1 hypothetical protein Pro02_72130 [Planobispora rosea]